MKYKLPTEALRYYVFFTEVTIISSAINTMSHLYLVGEPLLNNFHKNIIVAT